MRHNEQIRTERLTMVESWQQSGLSIRAYSELHHISFHTLQYWRYKIKNATPLPNQSGSSVPAFLPLKVKPSLGSTGAVFCELVTQGGRRLVFHQSVDAHFLKSLLD